MWIKLLCDIRHEKGALEAGKIVWARRVGCVQWCNDDFLMRGEFRQVKSAMLIEHPGIISLMIPESDKLFISIDNPE